MKALVLEATTYTKDIHGKPLVVGDIADLDPSLGNAWAGQGLVKIVDHEAATPEPAVQVYIPSEPEQDDADGRVYSPDGKRNYHAERRAKLGTAKLKQRKEKS